MEVVAQRQPAEARGDRQSLPHDDFRVEVEFSSGKGVIWLGHKKSKHQCDFTDDEPSYPLHATLRYIAGLKCLCRVCHSGERRRRFVLDVDVNLMLESEWILKLRYRFPLRRVSVCNAQVADLYAQLQGARNEIRELEALNRKLEDENCRLQTADQETGAELAQLRTGVEHAKEINQRVREANQHLQAIVETLSADVARLRATMEQLSEASRGTRNQHSETRFPGRRSEERHEAA